MVDSAAAGSPLYTVCPTKSVKKRLNVMIADHEQHSAMVKRRRTSGIVSIVLIDVVMGRTMETRNSKGGRGSFVDEGTSSGKSLSTFSLADISVQQRVMVKKKRTTMKTDFSCPRMKGLRNDFVQSVAVIR